MGLALILHTDAKHVEAGEIWNAFNEMWEILMENISKNKEKFLYY